MTDTREDEPLLFTFDNKLYTLGSFAKIHPGGEKILRKLAGSKIDAYLNGSERINGLKHKHSQAAYDILARYAVDHSIEKDVMISEETPILFKVGNLGDRYWTWIHQPYEGSLRLFKSDVLERMTRTKWYAVPLVWLPFVLLFALNGFGEFVAKFGFVTGVFFASVLFLLGCLTWTLLEYSLHRGIFHWHPNPNSYNQITLHFLIHGLHHKTPMDSDRLVFPPVPAALIIAFFCAIYASILTFPVFCCFGSGKLFGYICYDVSHYYLHHGQPAPLSNMHFRKVYHHNHHFKNHDLGYGISTVLWDYVFGTVGEGPL